MTKHKKIIFTIWLAVFLFVGVALPKPVKAFSDVIGGPTTIVKFVWEKIEKVYDTIQGIVGAELSNRMVGMFLDNLAYDVATQLAEGGPGGKPQFRTISIEKSLENAGNKALGEFLGGLTTKGFDDLGINLCDPSIELKLSLTLNLLDEEKPPKTSSKCEWSNLQKNWEQFGDNIQADIIKFQLNPKQSGITSTIDFFDGIVSREGSDLGIAFGLSAELNRRKLEAAKVLELSATECQGFIDKKTPITEEVITHCNVNHSMAENLFVNATQIEADKQLAKKQAAEKVSLANILKDAGNQFLNTFTSKLMKNWIKKGMWSLFGSEDNDIYKNYRETLIDKLRGGSDIRQPRGADIFKEIKTISIETLEDFNYIDDFAICPTEFRGPDNCVMSPAFLQAINNKLTLQQAIQQGIIDGNTPLVNSTDAINHTVDKCYRDGLCYSNLVKLRKANIIPVGWELAALRAPASLQQAIDCFEEGPDCDFEKLEEYSVGGNDHNKLYHLVDPDWVMKAPDVRCDAYSFSAILESPDSSNRQQYCADPKVCLREDSAGNCIEDQFNYCTRSENVWNFQDDACVGGEIYAGCLTFVNKDFGNNSYIQDTLEYCNANQAGCRRYSQDKDGTGNWFLEDIDIDENDLFLNNQAAECTSERAGCSEYNVLNVDKGVNLVYNGGFTDWNGDGFPDTWTTGDGITPANGIDDLTAPFSNPYGIAIGYDGDKVINGDSYNLALAYPTTETLNTRVILEPNTVYVLAIDMAQYYGARSDESRIVVSMCSNDSGCNPAVTEAQPVYGVGSCLTDIAGYPTNAELHWAPADWASYERQSCSFMTNDATDYAIVSIAVVEDDTATALWFDNVKIEAVSLPTAIASAYSNYGEGADYIYMDANTVMCSADEMGCQGYIPDNGDPMIPAVIAQEDLCPAECVDYATFAEQVDRFDLIEDPASLVEYYNFIPETAQQCPDQEIGCEEFTNLDVIAAGGEGREYFIYLRQCVEENLGDVYYTWEGTGIAGYQIKTWNALSSNISTGPCTNMQPAGSICLDVAFTDNGITEANEVAACGADTADPNDDPINNPNCREFFDINSNVYYRFQDRVIFATNNCHDYRRTLTDSIYKAVPEESISCAEANNGCRSYLGNDGNNVHIIFNDTFEQGTYTPWYGAGSASMDLSNESLNNNGHSVRAVTGSGSVLSRNLLNGASLLIQPQQEYVMSWWMKTESPLEDLDMYLILIDNAFQSLQTLLIDPSIDSNFQNIAAGKWHYYTKSFYMEDFGPVDINDLNMAILKMDQTTLVGGQGLYMDNFTIKAVGDSFSVVRNSWNTPIACDDPYTGYHLGCKSYRDFNQQDFNLKSFNYLCREDAIGCMKVIDTHNSSNPATEVFNVGDFAEITIDQDKATYLVPAVEHYCPKETKGCTELGVADRLDPTDFSTVYKINDPDQYAAILCSSEGLNCTEYNTGKGSYYMKDPGLNTCTYQQNALIEGNLLSGWFKTSSLEELVPLGCADTDGNPYTGAGIYDVGELILPRDYCSVSATNPIQLYFFTKNDCEDNSGYWNNYLAAAQCPVTEDLCTSFKDPVDPIGCDPKGSNLDFVDFDGFCFNGVGITTAANRAACELVGNTWILPSRDGYCNSNIYDNKRDCVNAGWDWTPYCKDYYYYDKENIDETACNGLVDRQDGCVLFYDANNWNGEHTNVTTVYDADETYEDIEIANRPTSPVACDPSFQPNCNLNANRLIKVAKDRQCAEWLACKSSTAVKDANDEYKIVCDDLDTCIEFQYDPDSNTTKCKKWGSYDEDVEALTFEKYQSRDTGLKNHISWSDKEYTGYSIPNSLPVSELLVYDFGEVANKVTRLVYNVTDSADALGSYYKECVDSANVAIDGKACTTILNTEGVYYFGGECQDRVCWVSPLVNQTTTSTYAIETRAYAVTDAPFPAAIEEDGINRLSKYDQANICSSDPTNPNACEGDFKKVSFGAGQETFYYPEDTASGVIPEGVCTSGITTDIVSDKQVPRACTFNWRCDSEDSSSGVSRQDGSCALRTEEIIFRNWLGICLEYDFDSPITTDDGGSYYCNQWYPAQKIKGTASLYNNYRQAGYYDPQGRDALFCDLAEPYITTEDRFYCGYFTTSGLAGQCNVLIKVPKGSRVNLDVAAQYSELLDYGTWLEEDPPNPNIISVDVWPAADNITDKDLILPPGGGEGDKFVRNDFNNVLPETVDFMTIIETMFDATDVIDPSTGLKVPFHRFYYDEGVGVRGNISGSAFINIPGGITYDESYAQCQDCPGQTSCSAPGVHTVYQYCKKTKHCGWHLWRNRHIFCSPYTYNYYIDLNSGSIPYIPPEPSYAGSCSADCKFLDASVEDSNHGRGCLQDSGLAPTYNNLITNFGSGSNFDLAACGSLNNDCIFVNCVENMAIANQNASHYCSDYDFCMQTVTRLPDPTTIPPETLPVNLVSDNLYDEIIGCFTNGDDDDDPFTPPIGDGVGPAEMFDPGEQAACEEDNLMNFRSSFISQTFMELQLKAYCSKCVLIDYPENYNVIKYGLDCEAIDPINCYQQCRIITQLDSEGLLSAVRTDIWWRSETQVANGLPPARIKQAFPWSSWYWKPTRGYVTSTPAAADDDEVFYSEIAGLGEVGDYPANFSHFGAGLDIFNPDHIVSTRVPYYKTSEYNVTAGTFFSYLGSSTVVNTLDLAHLEMQDLFYRVYNLNWLAASSTYQYYNEFELAGGNHANPKAGPDYKPRILATCDDDLCEIVDATGTVIGVEEGVTVNNVTGGTLIGQSGSLFVSAKFFYHAHPDHMPVYSVSANWGDGVLNTFPLDPGKYRNSLPADYCNPEVDAPGDANPTTLGREPQLMGFSGTERACQPGYKIFYHDYTYDVTGAHNCDGSYSGASGTPAKPIIPNASCYQPRINVWDNWHWETIMPFDGWVVVYEE